ncbi:MAG: signal peptidase I [Minisyncoccia bacterium]
MKTQIFLKIITVVLVFIFLGLLSWIIINKLDLSFNSKCPVTVEIKIVRGNSLEPLVKSGSQIKAFLGYYNCHEIQRGDLVLYRYSGDKVPLLKIVKGIPNDTFHLILNSNNEYNLLINNKVVKNSQGIPYTFSGNKYKMLALYENDYKGIIPPNTYLLLGDQVNGSVDATVFGLVDKSDIIGKAILLKK